MIKFFYILKLPFHHIYQLRKFLNYISSQVKAVRQASVQDHFLGAAWFLLAPIMEMVVYFLLFAVIFKQSRFGEIPAFHGILVGIIHFRIFQYSVQTSIGAIVSNRNTMLQVKIDPIVFVSIEFLKQIQQIVYYLPILLLSIIFFKAYPDSNIVWYPFVILILFVASWSCALLLSSAYVYLRDLRNVFQAIIFPILYSSPVIYPIMLVPERLLSIYYINPFATLFTMIQACLLGFPFPPIQYVISCSIFFIVLFFIAHIFYAYKSPNFTKVI